MSKRLLENLAIWLMMLTATVLVVCAFGHSLRVTFDPLTQLLQK